jgi:hypothetical protein
VKNRSFCTFLIQPFRFFVMVLNFKTDGTPGSNFHVFLICCLSAFDINFLTKKRMKRVISFGHQCCRANEVRLDMIFDIQKTWILSRENWKWCLKDNICTNQKLRWPIHVVTDCCRSYFTRKHNFFSLFHSGTLYVIV